MKKKKQPTRHPVKTDKDHPTLSVCLIVKNEEKYLDQCLRSIQSIADEIIVVDTGSTDGTLNIARKYTDKIWIHPWNESFSEARNHYLNYAKGDWIFQIDADEELVQEDIPHLRKAVSDNTIDGILIQIVNTTGKESSRGIFNVERIFRNNGVIHYEGRVHNRIVGITSGKIYPIRFIHYGYNPTQGDTEKKFDRSVPLLLKDLTDDPHNPITHHYLSSSYLSRNIYDKAIEHGLQAIHHADAQRNRDMLFLWTHYILSLSYYRMDNLKLAEDMAMKAIKGYPDHMDSHFMMVIICFDQKRWVDLIHHGEHYLRLVYLVATDPGHFGTLVHCSLNEEWNIHVLLGIARYESGDPRYADSFDEAIRTAPEPFVAARAAAIYFGNARLADVAQKYLALANRLKQGQEAVAPPPNRREKKKVTISCVMIVKNEEVFLEKCLMSVKDWVDEIIIVDTGSDDDTVNIARRFTDKVYFHPWEGSFSKARNQAMQYATGDWIYQIDGDEEMVEGSGKLLRAAVESPGPADSFFVTLISIYDKGRKTSRHNFERLFRNNGIIHYESIVHNQVVGQICTHPSKIEVMHYGYNVSEKKANEKFIRTTELLKKQIAQAPGNPMPRHYLSASYLSRGFNKECIEQAEKAIELAEAVGDDHTVYLWSHYNAAMAHYFLGNLENARAHALRAISKFENHMDSFHVLTLLSVEQNNWQDVLRYGEKYLTLRTYYETHSDEAGVLINNTMREGAGASLLMGHAYHMIGDKNRMQDCYRKAETMSDEPWKTPWNAANFHMDRSHDYEEAKRQLDHALHLAPEEQRIWHALAKLYFMSNDHTRETAWLTRLQEAGSTDESVLNRLAVLLIEDGKTTKAIDILNAILSTQPNNMQALINIGIAYKILKKCEPAIATFMKIVESAPEDPRPWHHLSEISRSLNRIEEAEIFSQRAQALQCKSLG